MASTRKTGGLHEFVDSKPEYGKGLTVRDREKIAVAYEKANKRKSSLSYKIKKLFGLAKD